MHAHIGDHVAQSCVYIFSHFLSALASQADLQRVVGPVAHAELDRGGGFVELLLELLRRETVQFGGGREHFLGVELLAKHRRKHLVDTEISQEKIIVVEENATLLVGFELLLKFLEADHFSDTGDVKILNLILEFTSGILD